MGCILDVRKKGGIIVLDLVVSGNFDLITCSFLSFYLKNINVLSSVSKNDFTPDNFCKVFEAGKMKIGQFETVNARHISLE